MLKFTMKRLVYLVPVSYTHLDVYKRQVLLHAAAGMKHREVAEALQMPLATVLSKYNRSMKKLQELLRCSG